MLVATGSFSPKRGFPIKFCIDFNHFKSIVMSALLHGKFWNAQFWTTLDYSFTCYKRKFNLLKSSLWICHLKMIKIFRKLDRKSSFTSAAIWWYSTLESGKLPDHIRTVHSFHNSLEGHTFLLQYYTWCYSFYKSHSCPLSFLFHSWAD